MSIRAGLKGGQSDLAFLTEQFPSSGDPTVGLQGEDFYLTSTELPETMLDGDHAALVPRAASLLNLVNGAARVIDVDFQPVQLMGRFWDPSGAMHAVVQTDSGRGRDHVRQPPPKDPTGPRHVQVGLTSAAAKDVLALLAKPEPAPDWFDLYKVYEIVGDNVYQQQVGQKRRQQEALTATGWISAATIKAFTGSANHQGASGTAARHARLGGDPPKDVMSLATARQVMQQLVAQWLASHS